MPIRGLAGRAPGEWKLHPLTGPVVSGDPSLEIQCGAARHKNSCWVLLGLKRVAEAQCRLWTWPYPQKAPKDTRYDFVSTGTRNVALSIG